MTTPEQPQPKRSPWVLILPSHPGLLTQEEMEEMVDKIHQVAREARQAKGEPEPETKPEP